MKWQTASAEAIGGREEQQDRAACYAAPDGSAALVAVADGMGGHRGGALAAQSVVDAAGSVWRDPSGRGTPRDLLAGLCSAAHEAINAAGKAKGIQPHSTGVFLLVGPDRADWAHVGDSRLYRFANGRLVERTRDHSVVQLLVEMGEVEEGEMATHPTQNRLLRSLGGQETPEPDFGGAELGPDDSFLLCSDGLWETVTVEEMAAALSADDLDRAARMLVALAAERGGPMGDNVTVALARRAP
jgi:serine/threonine protein phosphatase PrpC